MPELKNKKEISNTKMGLFTVLASMLILLTGSIGTYASETIDFTGIMDILYDFLGVIIGVMIFVFIFAVLRKYLRA